MKQVTNLFGIFSTLAFTLTPLSIQAAEVKEAAPRVKEECNVDYKAIQKQNYLTVYANGIFKSEGHAAWLSLVNGDTIPPEFFLQERKPFKAYEEKNSQFEVSYKALVRDKLKYVILHDRCGRHEIKVKNIYTHQL